eukprot:CAMPEP_0175079094 /NCGR_PEP_ID=MMETSP0052_2-20121109/24613_1 /TAXON_ID=51329 ORGANISM="Polytomella parva, Strain SAG 63-3" /NCGR_SAMPLE_ID=MMETSP0052_2 /ASSEMBLY_ACC=CAM_ASM_000194 /LENGTH=182 /DNA_ID=CAMNT_0016349349 /DNA_START=55 /DNA_END=600 /DNA_ORIENTATION=+
MMSLLYGLYEYLTKKEEFRILILGLDKSGKTNVLERIKSIFSSVIGLDPGKILPTVGLNVGRIELDGAKLVFWDLGGQSGLRSLWSKYFDEAHAIIYVVDSEHRDRFQESKEILYELIASSQLDRAPVLIFANKQDLDESADADQISTILDVRAAAATAGHVFKVLPISAYTGQGIDRGIRW